MGTGPIPTSAPDVDIGSESESEGSGRSSSVSEDDAETDTDDMSTEKLQSGSDLTAQVDPSTGRLLDDWYESEEVDEIPEVNGEDEERIDSEEEFNWGSDIDDED